jgi:TolB protein
MRRLTLGFLSLVLLLAITATAHATFPGQDGRISYNRFDENAGTFSLFSAKKNGRNERQLTTFGPGVSSVFSDWSPDGRLIAFDSDQGTGAPVTFVMNADGSHVRKLTDAAFSADPAWSPNGRRIAIEADWGDYPASEGIWTIPFRKKGVVGAADAFRVTTTSPDAEFDSEPQYSPSGDWIAFTRFQSAEESAIFRVRTDGSDLQQLTDFADNASAPDWSPDGRRIAYDTHDASPAPNAGNVMVMRPDGSDKQTLIAGTDADYNQNPVFSPSGRFIAYAVFPAAGGPPFIWIARVDGTHRRLLGVAGDTNKPDWGPKPRDREGDRHDHS